MASATPLVERAPETNRPTPASKAANTRRLRDPGLYVNRELSWLDFNDRVLATRRR